MIKVFPFYDCELALPLLFSSTQHTAMSSQEKITQLALSGKKTAVTLESSFLGFFSHAGFINSLLDSGLAPAKISGSSSGALVAAAYASGLKGEALREFILNRNLQRSFREWGMLPRCPSVLFAYQGHGLISGKRAVRYLRKNLPVERIEEVPLAELSIGVTNVARQKRELKKSGDLAAFIIASCAAAPVIRSQQIDGEFYLDGGFTDISPLHHWIDDDDIETIIMHRIITDPPRLGPWSLRKNLISCWSALHGAATDELQAIRIEQARAAGKNVIIHETVTPPPSLIISKQRAIDNYEAAYNSWKNSPHLTKN